MFQRLLALSLLMLAGLSSGCSRKFESSAPIRVVREQTSSGQVSPSKEASAEKAVTSIELTEANWNELQSLIAEQKGKVVVVDVWSTSCEPCMKEFPHLIQLQKQYPDEVVAISFDIDYVDVKNRRPTYYRERVVEFLASQGESKVLHRMCNTSADELYTEIDLDSIPAVYVYGRDGTLAKRFVGSSGQGEGVSYEKQINPFVAELVK